MNNDKQKIVLITRIKSLNKPDEIKAFQQWLNVFLNHPKIIKVYIIMDSLSNGNLELMLAQSSNVTLGAK